MLLVVTVHSPQDSNLQGNHSLKRAVAGVCNYMTCAVGFLSGNANEQPSTMLISLASLLGRGKEVVVSSY